MQIHLMPLFILVLFGLIFWEWRQCKKKKTTHYRFESSVLNIACGVVERVFDLYFFYGLYLFFNYLQEAFGFFDFSISSVGHWLLCIVLLDFLIYWFHRTSHSVNFLWGAHVTHHQCEEFNLTVAFRNSIFPHIFRTFFIIILPLLGFPAEMILGALTISGLWQFCIHTSTIGKLGWVEYIMSTPSAHRVHHACNDQYLDKNFGGMFIVWDRLLGTYEEEKTPAVFGLTHPLKSWNPVKAYVHVWQDLFRASRQVRSLKEKLKIWFGKPTAFYKQYYQEREKPASSSMPPKLTSGLVYYLINQLVLTTILLLLLLIYNNFISAQGHFIFCFYLLLSSFSLCLLMEQKREAFVLEEYRLAILSLAPLLLPGALPWILTLMAPLNLIWIIALKEGVVFGD